MHSKPSTTTTKLLLAAQWAITDYGIFFLLDAILVIALTPEAWPV